VPPPLSVLLLTYQVSQYYNSSTTTAKNWSSCHSKPTAEFRPPNYLGHHPTSHGTKLYIKFMYVYGRLVLLHSQFSPSLHWDECHKPNPKY
jgi:hypothetical protein